MTAPIRAAVLTYDRRVGLGTLRCEDGMELPFHAVAITTGTRDIQVGAAVLVSTVAGHVGETDARTVTPISGTEPDPLN